MDWTVGWYKQYKCFNVSYRETYTESDTCCHIPVRFMNQVQESVVKASFQTLPGMSFINLHIILQSVSNSFYHMIKHKLNKQKMTHLNVDTFVLDPTKKFCFKRPAFVLHDVISRYITHVSRICNSNITLETNDVI